MIYQISEARLDAVTGMVLPQVASGSREDVRRLLCQRNWLEEDFAPVFQAWLEEAPIVELVAFVIDGVLPDRLFAAES